ncbi:hypothetical protein GWK47_032509 [Chionoecetes opilio]|uniref:Uncharacterized protein n=1 Tax=Chionoecetes opilio TaxID=41210 RepID=A0A8J5D3S0_CHIOP|nr:hypothetical protein GWK47_032509 [Chionoecetes opilio]
MSLIATFTAGIRSFMEGSCAAVSEGSCKEPLLSSTNKMHKGSWKSRYRSRKLFNSSINIPVTNSRILTKLVPRLSSGRWTRGGSKGSTTTSSSQAGSVPQVPTSAGPLRAGSLPRGSLNRTPQRNSSGRVARQHHTLHARTTAHDQEDEKYSFKSCGRDSGHGGSEQEDSPRTGPAPKLSSLRLNNNVVPHLAQDHLVNPFTTANSTTTTGGGVGNNGSHSQPPPGPDALLPDYRLAGDAPTLRLPSSATPSRGHRNHSPWNHTYTEIPDGVASARQAPLENGTDPVYEEIEREGRSELQVSDLSDEDGRRHSSDISRQSSRSYGDHRPLLPYTLPDRHSAPHHHQPQYDPRLKGRLRHQDGTDNHHTHTLPGGHHMALGGHLDHTMVSPGHILPMTHAAVTSAHVIPHGNGHIVSQQYMDGVPHLVNSGYLAEPVPQYSQAMLATLGHALPVVHPLSEPNLRNWEAAQRHRDLQQLQQLGEMTVAVLSGEQVVCKLKPPLAPIDENTGTAQVERHPPPPTYSHC